MPWLLGYSLPYALEGLRNSSQPTWGGLEAKTRGLVYTEQIQDRVDSGVRCGLAAFGDGVGNGFVLSWPHPFCLSSSSSFSGLGVESFLLCGKLPLAPCLKFPHLLNNHRGPGKFPVWSLERQGA